MSDALPEITVDEAIAQVGSGAYLIDVREQDEWDAGHAPAAHLLPMSRLNDLIGEVPKDTPVLIVCHSGGRSLRVTKALRDAGYDATNVLGGMTAWAEAGGDVVK